MGIRSPVRRVALVRSPGRIAPHVMDDIAESLAFLGHSVLTLDLAAEGATAVRTPAEALACAHRLADRLRAFRPDVAFSYGLAGLIEMGGADGRPTHLFEWLNIPYVCLFYDAPLGHAQALSRYGSSPLASVLCWDRSYLPWLRSLGVRRLLYQPLATNARAFGQARPPAVAPEGCAFVGSLNLAVLESPLPGSPALTEAARRFISLRLEQPCADVEALLDQVAAGLPPEAAAGFAAFRQTPQAAFFTLDAMRRSDSAYRRAGVERAAAAGGIRVFGGKDWLRLRAAGLECAGSVAYGPGLADRYAATAVNLNLTGAHLRQAVNQRLFDAPAAGGFVLTDYRRDLEDLFDLEREIACFRTLDELAAQLDRFRKDDQARDRIRIAARRRILAHHTWDQRLPALLAWLHQDDGVKIP